MDRVTHWCPDGGRTWQQPPRTPWVPSVETCPAWRALDATRGTPPEQPTVAA